MLKILLLAIAFWLLYSLLKRYRNNMNQQPPAKANSTAANENSLMVQCAHCQVHLPSSESIKQGQLHFCSQDHARQHQS